MSVKAHKVQNYPGSPKKPARAAYEAGRAILALALPLARTAERNVQKSDFLDFRQKSTNFCRRGNGDFRRFLRAKLCFFVQNLHKYTLFEFYTGRLRNFYQSTICELCTKE